jgi:hypothetical protein
MNMQLIDHQVFKSNETNTSKKQIMSQMARGLNFFATSLYYTEHIDFPALYRQVSGDSETIHWYATGSSDRPSGMHTLAQSERTDAAAPISFICDPLTGIVCVAAACLQLIPKSGDECWGEIRSQNATNVRYSLSHSALAARRNGREAKKLAERFISRAEAIWPDCER